ncbi:DUF6708 domain-containing protein [Pseudomonas sp. Leaf127]|uniref:DUF6708 domain-containing protein n=1 Tax=Pseudomonas sp. Leaf127 TaxID=1736267 RepID=UPI000A9EA510|nr:DUF6708 domain-containing protein [Pseudomonas sp. Leaf127]
MISNNHEKFPQAGDIENKKNQRTFYLAPLPLPTGAKPYTSRIPTQATDHTYMDIMLRSASFEFAIRIVIALLMSFTLFIFLIALFLGTYSYLNFGRPILEDIYILFLSHWFIPLFLLGASVLYGGPIAWEAFLTARTPPIRFNRQRREVAYVARRGMAPHIVPWENLIACISSTITLTKYGYQPSDTLRIGLPASGKDEVVWLDIACFNLACALSEWETIRVYMEEGPDTRPKYFDVSDLEAEEGSLEHFHLCRRVYREKQGYLMYLFGFVFLQALGGWTLPCHIAAWIQRLPKTAFPKSIHEWSKPLPPDQWQQPSAELIEQSQAVQKTLRKGLTLIDHFTALSRAPTAPKPGSLTERRKRRREAKLQNNPH